jgi:hypothetical protein
MRPNVVDLRHWPDNTTAAAPPKTAAARISETAAANCHWIGTGTHVHVSATIRKLLAAIQRKCNGIRRAIANSSISNPLTSIAARAAAPAINNGNATDAALTTSASAHPHATIAARTTPIEAPTQAAREGAVAATMREHQPLNRRQRPSLASSALTDESDIGSTVDRGTFSRGGSGPAAFYCQFVAPAAILADDRLPQARFFSSKPGS